jgi:3-oxoacyl-[acyl-carrier protein] reductase
MIDRRTTILVTGPSQGLGLAIAHELVSADYRVIGIGRHLSDGLGDLISSADFFEFDFRNIVEIRDLVRKISQHLGEAPYGLVNNAAIGADGLFATQHEKDVSELLTVNLHAPMLLSKYVARQMLRKKTGRIVNVSSIIAKTGYRGLAVYGATKAGLEGFTRSFSRELGSAGITVNCVAPGFMETRMTSSLTGEKLASVRRRAPLGLVSPKDVASSVAYLLGSGAEKITGSVLTVDAGSTA